MSPGNSHNLTLNDSGFYIERDSIHDYIDLLYGGDRADFVITVNDVSVSAPRETLRGRYRPIGSKHNVEIFASTILESVNSRSPVGGNNNPPLDLRHGIYMVLAHELRHAWQFKMHGKGVSVIFRGRYTGRAGEIDARRHVDENYDLINGFLGM